MHKEILKFLPHRDPFLFVDSLYDYSFEDKSIVCIKQLDKSHPVFEGHFPDDHIFPGVLSTEAIAQAGIFLFSKLFQDKHPIFTYLREKDEHGLSAKFYLAGIENAKYHHMIRPSCEIKIYSRILNIKLAKDIYVVKLQGHIEHNDKKMAESILTCVIK